MKNYRFNKNTVIVTHSLGGPLAMKLLPKLKTRIAELIMVAPPLRLELLDNKPRPALERACDWKFDLTTVKQKVSGRIVVIRDLEDHIVPSDHPQEIAKNLVADLIDVKAQESHFNGMVEPEVLSVLVPSIKVFTTRPDTLFGATYMVLAPEHSLVKNLEFGISNLAEVKKYVEKTKRKTELQRQEDVKDKTGVELKGIKAINPATKEEIPIWIADYVLTGYGTGAIMAVPAHDERDFEFANKFNLPIKKVIEPVYIQSKEPGKVVDDLPFDHRDAIIAIVEHWKEKKYIGLKWKEVAWGTFVTGGIEQGQTPEEAARMEIKEETGYKNMKLVNDFGMVHGKFYHVPKKLNRFAHARVLHLKLQDDDSEKISETEQKIHEVNWFAGEELKKFLTPDTHQHALRMLLGMQKSHAEEGILAESGEFTGMDSEKAKWEITKFVGGHKKIQYRLRDWSVSRQRYWGVPIPMIYCDSQTSGCGAVPVPEKYLPVLLPKLENYRPKGVPPLAGSKEFIETKCPKCGGEAKRAAETLDTFVDSSWYFLRYIDPQNNKEIFDKKKAENWLPIDLYVIGAEHTTLHLLYARFITKFLHDLGYLKFSEPFLRLRHQGLILGEDGQKMSKSRGNVVNPDDLVSEFGADTVRLYEMFMGPFEQGQPWDSKGVLGVNRFLYRFWNYFNSVLEDKDTGRHVSSKETKQTIHKTIKKVSEDIKKFSFNTAISALMIALNDIESRDEKLGKAEAEMFLKIMHPFAPHLAQELWSQLGHDTYLDFEKWPEYDEALIKEEKITLVVQINGKVRDSFEVSFDIDDDEAKRLAVGREKISGLISGKEPKKIIYVPQKLVNIVI